MLSSSAKVQSSPASQPVRPSPPPIPVPDLLLDRARLKPIPAKPPPPQPLKATNYSVFLRELSSDRPRNLTPPRQALSARSTSSSPLRSTGTENQQENSIVSVNPQQWSDSHSNSILTVTAEMNKATEEKQLANGELSTTDDQDRIQPWQIPSTTIEKNRSNSSGSGSTSSPLQPSALERANSDAARLDSLARLTGSVRSTNQPTKHDHLPPFLIAQHLQQTQQKVQQQLSNELSLGARANARGVPRLSALQRKALEKLNNSNDSAGAVALARSNTTTCTESPRRPDINSDERQIARSNLIRKLSNRGRPTPKTANDTNPKIALSSSPPFPSPPPPPPLELTREEFELTRQRPRSGSLNDIPLGSKLWSDLPSQIMMISQNELPQSIAPRTPIIESVEILRPSPATVPTDNHTRQSTQSSAASTHRSTNSERSASTMNSEFRSYRHSVERDRDSVLDRMGLIDNTIDNEIITPDLIATAHSEIAKPTNQCAPCNLTSQRLPRARRSLSLRPKSSSQTSIPVNSNRLSLNQDKRASQSSISSRLRPRSSLSSRAERSVAKLVDSSGQIGRHPTSITSCPDGLVVEEATEKIPPPEDEEKAYQVRVSRVIEEMTRGSTVSLSSNVDPSLSHLHAPSNQFESTTSATSIKTRSDSFSDGPSQFPPPIDYHIPSASPADLARYNDSKLAPFPALLDNPPFSPPQSPTMPAKLKSPTHSTKLNHKASRSFFSGIGVQRKRSDSESSSNDTRIAEFVYKKDDTNSAKPHKKQAASIPAFNHSVYRMTNRSKPNAYEEKQNSQDEQEMEDLNDESIKHHVRRMSGEMSDSSVCSNKSREPCSSQNTNGLSTITDTRKEQILNRLKPFLNQVPAYRPNTHSRLMSTSSFNKKPSSTSHGNSLLDDPPRKLLWSLPIYQVVNATSVKDRFLFVFSDLLVITKPIYRFEESTNQNGQMKRVPVLPITLNDSFLTKSVVKIKSISLQNDEDSRAKRRGEEEDVMLHFVKQFNRSEEGSEERAVRTMIERGRLGEPSTIAKILMVRDDLSAKALGRYLSTSESGRVYKNFLERLKLEQIRLDDGLRCLLGIIRLPTKLEAIERLLKGYSSAWSSANSRVGICPGLAYRLVLGMMILSEELHHSLHDSLRSCVSLLGYPNGIKTAETFLRSFDHCRGAWIKRKGEVEQEERKNPEMDPEDGEMTRLIAEERFETMVQKIYQSVRRDRFVQARVSDEDVDFVKISVEKTEQTGEVASNQGSIPTEQRLVNLRNKDILPHRLIYQVDSDLITVTIPEPDREFGIKLFSTGLKFEPSFLSFGSSRSASFRIKGKTLGMNQMLFVKIGSHAARYNISPKLNQILVERAFMKETVQVEFENHLKTRRKYLFSFENSETRNRFWSLIEKLQAEENDVKLVGPGGKAIEEKMGPRLMSKITALQVLRDRLIPDEDLNPIQVNPHQTTTIELRPKIKKSNTQPRPATPTKNRIRSNSISESYIYTIGSSEVELQTVILKKRIESQQTHLKKHQQRLLREQMKKNLEGGKRGLDPYSISHKPMDESGNKEVDLLSGRGFLEKEEHLVFKRFIKTGDQIVNECQQNSLIPLVIGFLSMGITDPK